MNETLVAIQEAWDKELDGGRDEAQARTLADQFVAANPELFTGMAEMTVAELVHSVDVFRENGMLEEQWRVEAWLLHHYEPQNIGGQAEPTVRVS